MYVISSQGAWLWAVKDDESACGSLDESEQSGLVLKDCCGERWLVNLWGLDSNCKGTFFLLSKTFKKLGFKAEPVYHST